MRLPISIVPQSDPPRFKWEQTIETLSGPTVVTQHGMMPSGVESSLVELIELAIRQNKEIESLKKRLQELITKSQQVKVVEPPKPVTPVQPQQGNKKVK